MTHQEFKLTQFSKSSGCGCKIAPSVLSEILKSDEKFPPFPGLLVGNETNDDAAVMQLNEELCLISTTDFFMPIVDNPYDFGRIAAANAISDVYAMGGKPSLALAILGWPVEKLPAALAAQVLEGARFICRMAGIPLAGGHSIDSQEPIFGLSVTGICHPNNLKKNNTAREGDLLFLTKPLGVGIISTAAKRNVAEQEHIDAAIGYMCSLNKIGEVLGTLEEVQAMTDVTGFGLAGHLMEICKGSNLSAEIKFESIPTIPGLQKYLDQFIYPDMTTKNFSNYSSQISQLNAQQLFTLFDPQTSGGLLVAIDPEKVDNYKSICLDFGLQGIADQPIGRMTSIKDKTIEVM